MIKLIGFFVAVFMVTSAAADEGDFRCLKSIGLKSPLRLHFGLPPEDKDVGQVLYEGGSGAVPIKRIKEKEVKRGPAGRPSKFESHWREINSDGTGGTYKLVTQGARIYDFRYIRKKGGKIFRFEEDLEALTDKGCKWEAK